MRANNSTIPENKAVAGSAAVVFAQIMFSGIKQYINAAYKPIEKQLDSTKPIRKVVNIERPKMKLLSRKPAVSLAPNIL